MALAMKLAELVCVLYVENVFCFILQCVVVKIRSIRWKKLHFFCRFFSLCPFFDPYINRGLNEGVRQKVEDCEQR